MKQLGGQQQGVIDVSGFLALVFVCATVVGVFWYIAHNRGNHTPRASSKSSAVTSATNQDDSLPQRLRNDEGHFTLSYPAGWQTTHTTHGEGEDLISTTTLTSPSTSVGITMTYQNTYIPTDCIPDYYDKPFLTSNRCFSAEYVSADPLPLNAFQEVNGKPTDSKWYIARYHFKSITINAKELYASCLVIGKPTLNSPQMGFFADHPFSNILDKDGNSKGYLAACVDAGSQQSDLSKPEFQTGESVLRSLRFD